MATLADSLVSSSARKLKIRKRPDLTARRQRYHGRSYWVVKDPVGLHYYRFQEEEYAILQMLDGETSLDQVKDQFEAEFPPQKITLEELQQFLGMLHRSGLIIVGVQGQGTQLLKRRTERQWKELINVFSNVLAIRFKGIDPERMFSWIYPKIRWFFSAWMVSLVCILGLAALTLVAVKYDVVRAKLPTFSQFFTPGNAFFLAVVLGLTKVLHEFGHGLSCKHFGGECHELGVMILVLTPCLYCNVSDSWMLPNKWQRAAIGAAGMYVEMVLASIATFVWFYSTPDTTLNMLALNVMFVCSISTVVFNGNPLLRYDGYYILADVMEIPNLRQKATTILSSKMGEWCLGLEPNEDPFLPQRRQLFFALYSVAAALYRWVVVLSILFFLYQLGKSWNLEIFGQVMALASLYGLLVMPLWQLGKFLYVPGRLDKVKKPRMFATLGIIITVISVILFVPLPYSVMATVEIQAHHPALVYVDVPGKLEKVLVEPGQRVQAGQQLAELKNIELETKIAVLEGERNTFRARLEILEHRRREDPHAGANIPAVRDALQTCEIQLRQRLEEQKHLRLTAPVEGTVLPPPPRPPRKADSRDGPLPTWSGTPFDRINRGAFLDDTVLFCQIGDPKQMEAIVVIDQADIKFVRPRRKVKDANGEEVEQPGQRVAFKLDSLPNDILEGEIEEVSNSDMRVTSDRLSNKSGGEVATKTDPSGVERPLSPSYQARVSLPDKEGVLRLGMRGSARIYMDRDRGEYQTLGQRAWRAFMQTFNFKL